MLTRTHYQLATCTLANSTPLLGWLTWGVSLSRDGNRQVTVRPFDLACFLFANRRFRHFGNGRIRFTGFLPSEGFFVFGLQMRAFDLPVVTPLESFFCIPGFQGNARGDHLLEVAKKMVNMGEKVCKFLFLFAFLL